MLVLIALVTSCGGDVADKDAGSLSWSARLPTRERHPFLFYDASDQARMQERLEKAPWQAWWERMNRRGTRSTPAVIWWLTGDEKAAEKARADLLERPIWRHTPQGYLEPSSHRFADYVVAYDVLAAWEGLSEEDHRVIRKRIADEADHYYGVFEGVRGGANYGNQRTLAASALGMAALTLCEHRDSPIGPAAWLERALREIGCKENLWFFRPGGHFVEGAGYTQYMNVQFVPFTIALERATGTYLFEAPRFREWLTFAAYQMHANGELIPWGTCESGARPGYFGLLSNERYGRDLAPLFNLVFNLPSEPTLHTYHLHIALAQYEPDIEGTRPSASRAFHASQTAVLRENWGHASVAVWFAGKDGTWPRRRRYNTYSQGDAGHFVLIAWDEVLAADSGYDHWKSRDYFGAEFHNVLLIDGKGPEQNTSGEMSGVQTEGPVRRARVVSAYQGCTVRRTLALVRGRYVLVADRVLATEAHDYAWQVRSASPPGSPGSSLEEGEVTWPGLSASGWRDLDPGRTELTTVMPPFTQLRMTEGRWRPMSAKPEFINQVALAEWRGADTVALFTLIPNLREAPDLTWSRLEGQDVKVSGPGWTDRITVQEDAIEIKSDDGVADCRVEL
jgi:hypothetical protein